MVALVCAVLLVTAGAGAAKKKKAELVVTKLDDPPATLSAGDTLTIADKVKNRRGPKTKRSSNAYYLSVDPFRDQADFGLGSRKVPKLKAKKSSRGKADLKVPNNTYTGTYRLLACADAEKKVKERSESNNCRTSKGDVFIAGIAPPDTSPPNAPAITDTEPDPPASERTVAVKGNAEPGSTVRIFAGTCSGNSLGRGSAGVFASAGVSVTVPANETTRLRATATDDAGNESGCSAPFAYTHDPTLPPAPTITTVPGSPSQDASPRVMGSAAAGTTVRIYRSANCSGTPIATLSPAQYGVGIVVNVAANQTTQLSVDVTNLANNVSGCTSTAYTHDNFAAAPQVTVTTPPSPANNNAPLVRGTGAESGSQVLIFTNGNCSGSGAVTSTEAAFEGPGIEVTVPDNSVTVLSARVRDAAQTSPLARTRPSTSRTPSPLRRRSPAPTRPHPPTTTPRWSRAPAPRPARWCPSTGRPGAPAVRSRPAARVRSRAAGFR